MPSYSALLDANIVIKEHTTESVVFVFLHSFCPTDAKFASCSDDGTVRIWDFLRCHEERILRGMSSGSDARFNSFRLAHSNRHITKVGTASVWEGYLHLVGNQS